MISDDTIVSEANVAYVAGKFSFIKELKFIESTGTQYIDTGYKPNQDTKIEIGFFTDLDTGCIICGEEDWGVKGVGIWAHALSFGNYAEVYDNAGDIGTWNRRYKINAVVDNTHYEKNGITNKTYTVSNFQSPVPFYICCLNRNGQPDEFAKAKIYYVRIYENDILVRDFVPVSRNFEIGLWDNVYGVFYSNSGSGEFIAGPEAELPEGYTEVEYLEGNGQTPAKGPYISTDIKASGNAICFCDYQYVSVGNAVGPAIFGTRDANSQTANNMYTFMYRINDNNPSSGQYRFDYNRSNIKHNTGPLNTNRRQISIYNNELRYEDCSTITNTYANFQSSLNLSLFGLNTAGSTSNVAHARIYSFEYYDDGINRFFVPCKKNDGTFGLFELYTKVFYGNASNKTGVTDFTGGEDVSTERLEQPIGSALKPAFLSTITDFFGIGDKNLDQGKPLSVENLGYILNNVIIPVKRKSDNKAGMYDTIGKKFYASGGSQDFIAGPEL